MKNKILKKIKKQSLIKYFNPIIMLQSFSYSREYENVILPINIHHHNYSHILENMRVLYYPLVYINNYNNIKCFLF